MKLFQQLLVAPAALGLLAPMAVSAAELNLDGVNQYASEEQVTSISQFGDVKPTDWAYQALSNLIERYGCVAGYPDGTYRGQKAMTRFEAAALLNACLDRVTEVTDELKRLMAEFEKELAILKGRVDGLEAKVGELEANQFSTTTKLNGKATMVLGGAADPLYGAEENKLFGDPKADNVTFNYDVQLNLDTSFTGKDLLRTRLRAGNFADSIFGNDNTTMEVAFQEDDGDDVVGINRLFYQFPIGDNFTATFGAKVRQDDMLAMWPSAYPADTILDIFTYAGARSTYSLNLGGGAGLWWKKNGWSISAAYVSNENAAQNSFIGAGEDYTATAQLGYAAENWGIAAAYTFSDFGTYFGFSPDTVNSAGVSAYWQPKQASWFPSISAGAGWDDQFDGDNYSWMVGLQWADAFMKGNALGAAVGSAGQIGSFGTKGIWFEDAEETLAVELWYKFQVTDNISVTPAVFYIQNDNGFDDTVGGLVKTTFKF
ncbi:iron uptake porin [Synechococcus sp. GFB01]|uniref:iron uptake porin n=1 Tax=Synechococcus sp. GFB01 TaxID=1662190 RepID=UPI00064E9E64|nr:iron uptake porin [Synechococcus sp. GFB01]KMM16697.1 porin [Synechococcus sp. GFB01]